MLRNYVKVVLRSLVKNKTFSLINLSGLSIGLACFVMIGLYVVDEFSFDGYHEKADRIYQVTISAEYDGQANKWSSVPNRAAITFAKEIPEVERAVRILPNNFTGKAFVSSENIKSTENKLVWADSGIFEVFTIPFIHGNASNALARPHTVTLSEAAAIKYFGSVDAIGKSLRIDKDTLDFEVTGVYENPKANSRFQFPIIASFLGTWGDKSLSWGNASFETYLLLHENTDPTVVDKKIEESLSRNIPKDDRWFTLEIHPLKDIHLRYPDVKESLGGAKGDLNQLNILIGLGLIIILIAAVNYMNLSTAQSQRRFKEIGINKTLGATSQQLARKFYLETAVFVLFAMVISIQLIVITLPFFNSITGKNFSMHFIASPIFWGLFLVVWTILTLLAGFYPALYLSSFSPRQVLKGSVSGLGGNSSLRKILVVVQFSVSIILIICTLILYQQLEFIKSKELGFSAEQVIAIPTDGAENKDQISSFKTVLEGLASVKSVARSQSYPGMGASGRTLPKLEGGNDGINISTVRATPEILDALGIRLLAGKTLPLQKDPKDTTIQVILNKKSIDYLGLTPEESVNRIIEIFGFGRVEVVGVTEDFHFTSLREPIAPYAFHNAKSEGYAVLLVKIQSNNLKEAISQIESEYKKIIPSAFEFTFLDQYMQSLYSSEEQLAKIIFIFAGLAIFIACLGLYALAAYTTEQRTKEIGIRKVMGATVLQLSSMLSKDFLKLVGISFIIAAPTGYYAMHRWLESYAYRVDVSFVIILLAGFVSIGIAWLTVSFESLKAARSNPVRSLRSE